MRALGSFRHEYEQYREHEIEQYKDSVPRDALLAVGDEAVERLRGMPEAVVSDLVLCDEVDRIIARRLKLPSYRTWRRRHMARLADWRMPGHWGLADDGALVQELLAAQDGEHVLVAGATESGVALFAAALGCAVTAVAPDAGTVDQLLSAAQANGLGRRVRGVAGRLVDVWLDAGVQVVVCDVGALAELAPGEQDMVVDALQRATLPGGAHIVRATGLGAPEDSRATDPSWALPTDALDRWYGSWTCTREGGSRTTFVARKTP